MFGTSIPNYIDRNGGQKHFARMSQDVTVIVEPYHLLGDPKPLKIDVGSLCNSLRHIADMLENDPENTLEVSGLKQSIAIILDPPNLHYTTIENYNGAMQQGLYETLNFWPYNPEQ